MLLGRRSTRQRPAGRGIPLGAVPTQCRFQRASRRFFDRRRARPRPARPAPRSDRVAGSGAGVLTPARKTVGGWLAVLPPLPHARKYKFSVAAALAGSVND